MAKKASPFFARIKRDVLAVLAAVPVGRLVTFADVGAHLDVPPRHVAYILSQLDHSECAGFAWYRAIPESAILSKDKSDQLGRGQGALLIAEGHLVAPDGRIMDAASKLVSVGDIPHGVARQQRPADAPRARTRKQTFKARLKA